MKLAIIGAGELGKLIAYHALNDSGVTIAGYYDDFVVGNSFNNYPLLGKCDEIISDYEKGVFDKLFIGIGYAHMSARERYFDEFKGKIPFANVIHSSSYVDSSCNLGEGIFILPGNTLDFGVKINDNVLINTGGIIAHHTEIGKHTFIAPGVHIAGLVNVMERCFIGIGAVSLDCITIRENASIGAGSVVTKNTESNSVYYGVPAHFIRRKN